MVRSKIFGLLLVAVAVIFPSLSGYSQVAGPGNCTNYGCIELNFQAPYDITNGQYYCMQFGPPTGRKVRNARGIQGGYPVPIGGTQQVKVAAFDCGVCTVPPGTVTAREGMSFNLPVPQTFGNYECSL